MSTVSTARSLGLKSVCIRDLFSAPCFSYSRQFCTGVPWELLCANDLAVMVDSLEECIARLKVWKEGMESQGLSLNMKKTKFIEGHKAER